jgi:hypothetical protein
MKTTLNKIREHSPCESGWKKLLFNLGKVKADDDPVSVAFILESNGLDDALWCLRAVDGYQREVRLYAVDCARMVQHLMTDQRSLDALNVAERHADGLASDEDLTASWDAARSAARSAARDARSAAWTASWAAARSAARDARSAAWTASWAAARSAARAAADAAWAASWAAEDTARADQANLLALMCAEIEQREEV